MKLQEIYDLVFEGADEEGALERLIDALSDLSGPELDLLNSALDAPAIAAARRTKACN